MTKSLFEMKLRKDKRIFACSKENKNILRTLVMEIKIEIL